MTPAPVSIVDRGTFCLMDLSRVGYVISICEYDERGKVVLRPDFRGQQRLGDVVATYLRRQPAGFE